MVASKIFFPQYNLTEGMWTGLIFLGNKMCYSFKCDGLMEVNFNSYSLSSNGKPKRFHTSWELKKQLESKMKVDSQNPGEKNHSEKASPTSLTLCLFFLLYHQVKAKCQMFHKA